MSKTSIPATKYIQNFTTAPNYTPVPIFKSIELLNYYVRGLFNLNIVF